MPDDNFPVASIFDITSCFSDYFKFLISNESVVKLRKIK